MTTSINDQGAAGARLSLRWRGFLQMAVLAIVSAALFWLLRDHWNHVLGYAPYLLFLVCPLTHLFMHRGHGRRSHGHVQRREKKRRSSLAGGPGSEPRARRASP